MFRHTSSHKNARWGGLGVVAGFVLLVLVLSGAGVVSAKGGPYSDKDLIINGDALHPPDMGVATFCLQTPNGGGTASWAGVPGYYQTSDYMIGHVAVGLILPESNGAQEAKSESWTDKEIARVQSEVQDALDWWASLEPAAHLTFTVEVHTRVPVGYEPIQHGLGEERLWIGESMAALGFESVNYFSAVRDYVNDLRDRVGSDWAFTIFVVDSSEDIDGRFADGYFAYAYIGGPFFVMTFDNSAYGIHNMDAVAAHETGHIFRALDQYAAAGMSCNYRAGYLYVKNGNSQAGGDCESDAPSIMRGGISPYYSRAIDDFARGQIGWWDSDGDGVLDPVDAEPRVEARLTAVRGENADMFNFNGLAWQEAVTSPMLSDVTISHITTVGALVDGETWVAATPQDGAFDTLSETFQLEIGPLGSGLHTLSLQSINSEGLTSTALVTTVFVYDPVDGALSSVLRAVPETIKGEGPARFDGIATAAYGDVDLDPKAPTVATVQFSIDGGTWYDAAANDGQFDGSVEDFGIFIGELSEGLHTLSVRAVDSNGQVERNGAVRQFRVDKVVTLYFPLIYRGPQD